MILIKCNECSQEISDKESSCPNCGTPNIQEQESNKEDEDSIIEMVDNKVQPAESPVKKAGFFKRYFTYNNENISGSTYFLRTFAFGPLLCLLMLPGFYWLYIISFKRAKALKWSNRTCHIIAILNSATPFILITIPIHFILWFGMFEVKKE